MILRLTSSVSAKSVLSLTFTMSYLLSKFREHLPLADKIKFLKVNLHSEDDVISACRISLTLEVPPVLPDKTPLDI